ncbi:MAG TPA: NAD(P)/FAD-dependent oxidoreductase [Syntrophus sp. (in: bacteria)]|nr:NAD(P)/FAD-dependent oxidoreductase [Syntrophus sp. (in: bacteria)]
MGLRLAIIGGGPGGLYGAIAAARQGMEVVLFEKGEIGDHIVCGECIFDSLGLLEKPEAGLLYKVEAILLEAQGVHRLAIRDYRNLWMMDRRAWQRHLAIKAENLGVVIHRGEKIGADKLSEIKTNYDWILDASGAPSVTSRAYGFSREYQRECLLAHQYVLEGDFSHLQQTIKVGFISHIKPEYLPGYYWIFPRDEQTANVGVVYARGADRQFTLDIRGLLHEVLERESLGEATVLRKGGGLIPACILPDLVHENILLVGDAAGLTSPLHGGGIDLACMSGVLAVETIMKGKQGVAAYRDNLLALMKNKTTLEALIIKKMRHLSFGDFDDLLHAATVRKPWIRMKVGLRHPELLIAAWRWLRKKPSDLL